MKVTLVRMHFKIRRRKPHGFSITFEFETEKTLDMRHVMNHAKDMGQLLARQIELHWQAAAALLKSPECEPAKKSDS